jgi:IclR family mhp operon transcriptional activator
METLETNSSRTYFDELPPRPRGFRVNLLGSASGRAYLAFCSDQEFDAMITRLRQKDIPAHRLAFDDDALRKLVATTRERGYSVRAPDFGGDYYRPRAETDDGRSSIAMPVRLGDRVVAAINLTWRRQVLSLTGMVQRHLEDLRAAVHEVEQRARAAGFDAG